MSFFANRTTEYISCSLMGGKNDILFLLSEIFTAMVTPESALLKDNFFPKETNYH